MTPTKKPFVLHVDDFPDELGSWTSTVASQGLLDLEVCRPDEVTEAQLLKASLVLVDFKLDEWPERANTASLALRPVNGLALLSVLQEAALTLDPKKSRAFALFTSVIADVARGLPHRPHLVARAHNLEWLFQKSSPVNSVESIASFAAELALAVAALPPKWPNEADEAASALQTWLDMPKDTLWGDTAWEGIVQCRPPIHNFAEHTLGVGVLRWALHKILPYPTFLLDDAHLAARLRVTVESLVSEAASQGFQALFGAFQYQGQLKSIQGRRWWRAGIEHAIFNLTENTPGSLSALHAQLETHVPGLKIQSKGRVFAVLDGNFQTKPTLAHETEGVAQVRPDDWPTFADEAWALESDIEEDPTLKATRVAVG